MATIQDRIRSIVASKLGITEDEITPDKNLTNDLGADSLDVVELSMELEREFNLKFEDTDTEKIQTVEDLYKLIEEYTSKLIFLFLKPEIFKTVHHEIIGKQGGLDYRRRSRHRQGHRPSFRQ